jgi:transposase
VARFVTVFPIAKHRGDASAQALWGRRDGPVVGSDRFGAWDGILACWRPVCWAPRRRAVPAMSDRGDASATIGRRWRSLSKRWFRPWRRVRDGTLEWRVFQERMGRWRREVQQTLRDGSRCGCVPTAATCFAILKVEEAPWTFPRVPGVEPTHHAVERALRHAVIGRRIRGGTDRVPGSRFGERMLSVVATCRQQGRNVLEYQTSCFEADRRGQALPSLVPAQTPDIKVA